MAPAHQATPPPHWPPHLTYLARPSYHSSVPPSVLSKLRPLPPYQTPPVRPSQLVRIQPIPSSHPSHPARGQSGLFARARIAPGEVVCVYLGEVHGDERPESDYDLTLFRDGGEVNVGVDAARMGNEGRFVNDYRGIRERPNAEFGVRRFGRDGKVVEEGKGEGELRMVMLALKGGIAKGEEICVSYGRGWWAGRGGPPGANADASY